MIIKDSNTHLDSKGRYILSKAEYIKLGEGEKVVVVKVRDNSYFILYTEEEWNQLISKKLKELKGVVFRTTTRILCSSAFVEKVDEQRRVLIYHKKTKKEGK